MNVKALKPFALIVAIMVMVSLACLSGGPTPAPEPEPSLVQEEPSTPIVQVEPTQTIEPTETSQPSAQQFFTEEFDSDNDYWTLDILKNDASSDITQATAEVLDGVFNISIDGKNLSLYSFYRPYEYEDVKIDLHVENRGTNDNQINIICRATEEGWYEFSIANSGLYVIYAVEPSKGYRKLHDGGSTKIKPGREFNDYTVICKGRTMSLFVNGNETRVFEENEYVFSKGQVGIGVSSFNTLPVEIEINSVTISEP